MVANDGTTQTANLYGLDLISQDDGTGMRTLLTDGLGSVRQEMAGGVVETTTTYGPYGKLLAQTGASGTVYGYTGEQEDSATGLVYLRARYYSLYLNQFMSRDPWGGNVWRPDTLHAYSYVGGNPVNLIDPAGECYGPFRFLRQIEGTNCANQDLALSIVANSNASGIQRLGAATYTTVMGGSHIMLGTGMALGGYAAGAGGAMYAATHASGMLTSHTTLAAVAGALPYAAVAANFGDDALTAYAAATGDPYAQEQAIMAQQMAMADGGSPLFDGLGGLLGAAKLGRRSLLDFIGSCNMPRFWGGGSGGGSLDVVNPRILSSHDLYWSQLGVTKNTGGGIMLDDLSQSIASGWNGPPLRIYNDNGVWVSLDNRRLTAAKLIGIDVPVTVVDPNNPSIARTIRKRDGAFSEIFVRYENGWSSKTGIIIGMDGQIIGEINYWEK